MHRAVTGCLTAAALAAACISAFAGPAELMPGPLEGWTAKEPSVNESAIEGGGSKRIKVTRDYMRAKGGLRILLNTHDSQGAQLIAFVNQVQAKDPAAAKRLAAKGISPFTFKSRQGVMLAAEGGTMSGAALKLGRHGTLTFEGVLEDKPATVAPGHVQAYLTVIDLERMAAFVKDTNASRDRNSQKLE